MKMACRLWKFLKKLMNTVSYRMYSLIFYSAHMGESRPTVYRLDGFFVYLRFFRLGA